MGLLDKIIFMLKVWRSYRLKINNQAKNSFRKLT